MKKNALKCSSKDAKDKTEEFFCTRVMPVLYIDQDLLNGVIKTANSLDNNPVKSITQTDIIKYAKN
ncbi:MAG: hypothetical protein MJ219_00375 [Mycoplasmoidaceae bacterium]|nr:hypothetical protein [Mycoplasmoidaceae bacterium]